MRLQGKITIKAPRLIVWHFLTNPEAVSACAPGVTLTEVVVPNKQFTASVSAGFNDLRATFATEVEFVEMHSPDHAKFRAHGVANNAAVDVVSEMNLQDLPGGGTEVSWTADIVVVGQLVVLASGRINMVTRQMTDTFFETVRGQIETIVSQRGFSA